MEATYAITSETRLRMSRNYPTTQASGGVRGIAFIGFRKQASCQVKIWSQGHRPPEQPKRLLVEQERTIFGRVGQRLRSLVGNQPDYLAGLFERVCTGLCGRVATSRLSRSAGTSGAAGYIRSGKQPGRIVQAARIDQSSYAVGAFAHSRGRQTGPLFVIFGIFPRWGFLCSCIP